MDNNNTAHKKKEDGNGIKKGLIYFFLVIWGLIVLFPFYWMILTSVKSYSAYNSEYVPSFIAKPPTLENYKDAFTAVPLARYFLNTIIFTVITTALIPALSIALFASISSPPFHFSTLMYIIPELSWTRNNLCPF